MAKTKLVLTPEMEAKKIKLEPKPQHNEKIGAKKNRKKTSKNRAKAIKRTKTKEKKKAKRILRILGSTNSTIIVSDLNEGVQIRCNSPAEVSNQFETESVTNEEIRHWIRTGLWNLMGDCKVALTYSLGLDQAS